MRGLLPFGALTFRMAVDYIRVYRESSTCRDNQTELTVAEDPSKRNVGCDPESMPTAKYISL
jgi:hypothetical protein